jgi:hypothetical protein
MTPPFRNRYPGRMIDVLNRDIGGQEAPEELTRIARLVAWTARKLDG